MIHLLTHPREFERRSNTGRLVSEVMAERCVIHSWHRTEPPEILLSTIQTEPTGLLYPSSAPLTLQEGKAFIRHWVILDGTWQEARKMFNQSPYLHALPCFTLSQRQPSRFSLRANQKQQGLCTLETVAELVHQEGNTALCEQLYKALDRLIEDYPKGNQL